jgi:hypothetical protein
MGSCAGMALTSLARLLYRRIADEVGLPPSTSTRIPFDVGREHDGNA